MPLTINCGLSRKCSENFQSTGVSINVTAELDRSLLARPHELQQQVSLLYGQAEEALKQEVERVAGASGDAATAVTPGTRSRYEGRRYDNADRPTRYTNSTGGRRLSPMTASQRRAIHSIASRLGIDPHVEAQDVVGMELNDLTLAQASQLIDHLKAVAPSGGNGGGR